ncbi:MAG: radical SAM protein, partial [Hyphococcus sp.]
ERGLRTLILTNAMRPMMRPRIQEGLLTLKKRFGETLALRVSLDHFTATRHDEERGGGAFEAGVNGLRWLSANGFAISVAGRTLWGEAEPALREGFAALFAEYDIALDARDPGDLILFPEMDETADVPEITTACWDILGKRPDDVMCANARMLVKRKGAPAPTVLACTLIPYDSRFEIGRTLREAARPVNLNHPHCARFCVLGGASCSG